MLLRLPVNCFRRSTGKIEQSIVLVPCGATKPDWTIPAVPAAAPFDPPLQGEVLVITPALPPLTSVVAGTAPAYQITPPPPPPSCRSSPVVSHGYVKKTSCQSKIAH